MSLARKMTENQYSGYCPPSQVWMKTSDLANWDNYSVTFYWAEVQLLTKLGGWGTHRGRFPGKIVLFINDRV
jgi:hypothetical protein